MLQTNSNYKSQWLHYRYYLWFQRSTNSTEHIPLCTLKVKAWQYLLTTSLLIHCSCVSSSFGAIQPASIDFEWFLLCFAVYASPLSLSFLRRTAGIMSASGMAHATAFVESGIFMAGAPLFYSLALTFRCHGTRTFLQLLRSQLILLLFLGNG